MKKISFPVLFFTLLFCLFNQGVEAKEKDKNLLCQKLHYIFPDGIKVSYTDTGDCSKPAILFIPGFPLSGELFVCQIEDLKHHYRVVTLDLPPFGYSDHQATGNQIDIAACARYAKAVAKHLKLRNFVLVGFSYGSVVAELYAIKDQGKTIRKLILMSPYPGQVENDRLGIPSAALDAIFELARTDRKAFNREFALIGTPDTCSHIERVREFIIEIEEETPTHSITAFEVAGVFKDNIRKQLHKINIPVLIQYGINDSIENTRGLSLLARLTGGRSIAYPGGHMFNITQSISVNRDIVSLINEDPNVCPGCLTIGK